ncbi:MAG: diguanylate cyclase [Anaerolineaceae bacterium]
MSRTRASMNEPGDDNQNHFWFKKSPQNLPPVVDNLCEGVWCFEPQQPVALTLTLEEKLRLALDSICVGTNQIAAAMWGKTWHSANGLRFSDVVLNDGVTRSSFRHLVEGEGRVEKLEWSGKNISGQPRHFTANLVSEIQNGSLVRIWGWQRDITEDKQMIETLRTSESRLRYISDNMLDLIFEADAHGMINYASPSNQALLGYRPQDLVETSFFDIVHPDDRKFVQAQLNATLRLDQREGQTPLRIEYRLRDIDGQDIDVESVGKALRDEFGQVSGFVLTTRDIRQRMKAERLQKALYRISAAANTALNLGDLFQQVHQIVAELFPVQNLYVAICDEANRGLTFPYVRDEFEEEIPDPQRLFPYDEIGGWLTMYLIRKGTPQLISPDVFEELVRKGEVISVGRPSLDWLGVPLKTSEGKIIGALVVQTYTEGVRYGEVEKELLVFVSTQIAMTIEHRRVQDALRESEARQRAILNALPDLMFLTDRDGVVLNVFTHEDALQEMVGKRILEILHTDSSSSYLQAIQKAFDTGDVQMVEYTQHLGSGDRYFEAHIAACGSNSALSLVRDITRRVENEQNLARVNNELTLWVNELQQHTREVTLLNRMGDMLQSCLNVTEAYSVIKQYAEQLFPGHTGALYTFQASRNMLDMMIHWGGNPFSEVIFPPEACWALRRGRVHVVADGSNGLHCRHLIAEEGRRIQPYLCVPMAAHGDPLGLLYLRSLDDQPINRWESLAVTMSEQIGLALANLNLREILSSQSIRDPLTNLFNRRYLQETLERELSRAQRYKQSLGFIMADVDHFKEFNNSLGHDAGDEVLQELGRLLLAKVRKEDIACRYGGDEFAIVLPGATLENTRDRANQIREAVRQLKVQQLTLSMGVAAFPMHGASGKDLLRAADMALYRAKKAGRDRVEVCGQPEQELPEN